LLAGLSKPGNEIEARTASSIGPSLSQISRPVRRSVATAAKGLVKLDIGPDLSEEGNDLPASNEAAARQANIEKAGNFAQSKGLGEVLQRWRSASYVRRADESPDRATAHDVSVNACLSQSFDDANVRPAARRTTTKRKADAWASH